MLWNLLISLINFIIKSLAFLANAIVLILPNSPFQMIDNSAVAEYMGILNWIIPLNLIVSILQAWIVAVSAFYLQMIVLRWIKAIN